MAEIDLGLERALVVINILSVICSMLLLLRLKSTSWGIKVVHRIVTIITVVHLVDAATNVLQYFPLAFTGNVVPWKDHWTCKAVGVFVQATVVSDFLWSALLIWIFLMLLRGKSSESLERSHRLQIFLMLALTVIACVIPFFDREGAPALTVTHPSNATSISTSAFMYNSSNTTTGYNHRNNATINASVITTRGAGGVAEEEGRVYGYGYIESDIECWIVNPKFRPSLYGVFVACFAFAVSVLLYAAYKRVMLRYAPTILVKMVVFVGFFSAFWALQCARRILQFGGYELFTGVWLKVLRVMNSSYGIGSFILWATLLIPNSNTSSFLNRPNHYVMATTLLSSSSSDDEDATERKRTIPGEKKPLPRSGKQKPRRPKRKRNRFNETENNLTTTANISDHLNQDLQVWAH